MQPSADNLGRPLGESAFQHHRGTPRISPLKAIEAIQYGERRPPTAAELPYALEQCLRQVERHETFRRLLRMLIWVCSLLVLEGDESARD